MTPGAAMAAEAGRGPWMQRLLVWGCGFLLGMLAADAVIGSYNAGLLPLKPALFALGAVMACLAFSALNKPRLLPVCLGVLLLPLVRLFDAGVLMRAESTYQGQTVMDLLRMILVLVAILAVLSTDQGLRVALVAAIVAISLTTLSEVAEMLGLARFTSIPGRYAGFNGHPNFPPVLICEMLGIIFALSQNFRFNCLMIGLAVPGVALTYGRSGFIVLALMVGVYILMNARRHIGFLLVIAAIAVPALGVGVAVLQSGGKQGMTQDKNISERLQAIYELDFEKLKSPERAKDLQDAWEAVLKKPLAGHGTGVSGSRWAPHNEYVSLWLEMGIPGLLLFAGTMAALVIRSIMTGGRAGYLVFAILAYTPAGQGRIEMPHFCLALSTAAVLLWPQRYRIVLRPARTAANDQP